MCTSSMYKTCFVDIYICRNLSYKIVYFVRSSKSLSTSWTSGSLSASDSVVSHHCSPHWPFVSVHCSLFWAHEIVTPSVVVSLPVAACAPLTVSDPGIAPVWITCCPLAVPLFCDGSDDALFSIHHRTHPAMSTIISNTILAISFLEVDIFTMRYKKINF